MTAALLAALVGASVSLLVFAARGPLRAWGFAALPAAHRIVREIARRRRRAAIDRQLAGVVRRIASSVGAGSTLAQAIERAAERAPAPICTEFRTMAGQWRLGSEVTAILDEARRRLSLPAFDLFASALVVNQRMGGPVIATLERLAESLDEIDRMNGRIRAETSEGRANVRLLVAVPPVMLGFVGLVDRAAVGLLFSTAMGLALLGVAALLTLTGFAWAWSIVHADL